MMAQEDRRDEWLPVAEINGIEYVVDVDGRQFRPCCDPGPGIGFYTDTGRAMIRAMIGTEWRSFVPRSLWERHPEQVV